MKHLDLFSGIGGFSLAADWAFGSVEHIFCEILPYCQKILKKHYPESKIYDDIRKLKADQLGHIDLLTGGFPCQPFSAAGKRKGTLDNRHLWPEMLRVIQECRPTWIIAENVRGILNIEEGMVFEQVCLDLEAEGYDVQPFVIPACAVNAPHRRDRVWFIAHNNRERRKGGRSQKVEGESRLQGGQNERRFAPLLRRPDIHSPELCGGGNGVSERLDALGNAIVPQIAYEIMKAINEQA